MPGLDITSLDVQLGQAVADVGWAYCTCHVGIPASIRCRCVHGQQCHDERVTLAAATAQYRTAVLDSAVSYIVPFQNALYRTSDCNATGTITHGKAGLMKPYSGNAYHGRAACQARGPLAWQSRLHSVADS